MSSVDTSTITNQVSEIIMKAFLVSGLETLDMHQLPASSKEKRDAQIRSKRTASSREYLSAAKGSASHPSVRVALENLVSLDDETLYTLLNENAREESEDKGSTTLMELAKRKEPRETLSIKKKP